MYIEFEPLEELQILYKIYDRLIESCYNLKSYNQAISYIKTLNGMLKDTFDTIDFSYSKYFVTYI